PDLPGDLARRQVAAEAHLAGQTEVAVHRAADLTGDAEGLSRRVGDVDRLDSASVLEPEEELARAVGGAVLTDELRRADAEQPVQFGAQAGAEIRHRGEVRHAFPVHPAEDLPGPEPRDAGGGEHLFQAAAVEVGEVLTRGYG